MDVPTGDTDDLTSLRVEHLEPDVWLILTDAGNMAGRIERVAPSVYAAFASVSWHEAYSDAFKAIEKIAKAKRGD